MNKLYIFIIFIIFISSCSMDSSLGLDIKTTCREDTDCLKNEKCEVGYCITDKPEYSKALFSLEFIPTNEIGNDKFIEKRRTAVVWGVDVETNERFELDIKGYHQFSGEIISIESKNYDISYRFTAIDKSTNKVYRTFYSYKEDGKTLYNIKLVNGVDYTINVYPSKIYPTFTVSQELLSLENINVENIIGVHSYLDIFGKLKIRLNQKSTVINKYEIYAYINNGENIQVISNRFICEDEDKTCDFKLKVLELDCDKDQIEEGEIDFCDSKLKEVDNIFLKISSDLDEYKNLEFHYPFSKFGELLKENQVEVDLGNINKIENKNLTLSADSDLSNVEFSINGSFHEYNVELGKYELNEYIKFKNRYTCSDKNCSSFNSNENHIYEGSYNIFIEPLPDSLYTSKFLNIELIENQAEINIELKNKKTVKGVLFTKENGPIEGTVEFTRKDNLLTNFKTTVNTDKNGNFTTKLEVGEYDILIKPENLFSESYSNWIYLNQRITENTDNLSYIVPRSYKTPVVVHSQGNNLLPDVRVIMHLHNLEEAFELNDKTINKNNLPESYPLTSYITDQYGKTIISVPIITKD